MNTPRIIIRKVDGTDVLVRETIRALAAASFPAGVLVGSPIETTGHWWLALEGTTPVAFAGVRASCRSPGVGYLCLAGVLPTHRGYGLQVRLTKKRCATARALGWTSVITEVINDNPASMRSLLRCGFLPYKPDVMWGDPHAVYFRKQL